VNVRDIIIGLLSAALGGGILTAIGSYLSERRQNSGKVETSDATTLWNASEKMRLELTQEVERLRGVVAILEQQVRDLTRQTNTLAGQAAALTEQIHLLTGRLEHYEDQQHTS
jgi:chromosome segregation ATPase